MPNLLIDTSGEYAVLALAEEGSGELLAAKAYKSRRTLSIRLMDEVDALLTGEGIDLGSISAFGVGLGPGSFTGVRVGVTTMKTLAQVTNKPLVGIPTLDAYAAAFTENAAQAQLILLPSRRGEAYAAVYTASDSAPIPFAESLMALAQRLQGLEVCGAVLCVGAVQLLPTAPRQSVQMHFVPPDGLARVMAARLAAGTADDPLALTPLYVVPPSISTPKERVT